MELSNELFLEIAGRIISISGDNSVQVIKHIPGFNLFQVKKPSGKKIWQIHFGEILEESKFAITYSFDFENFVCDFGHQEMKIIFAVTSKDGLKPSFRMEHDGGNLILATSLDNPVLLRFTLWMAFNLFGLLENMSAIHSSCVSYEGKAVLFLGESGTGKSTQTRIWTESFANATLLNDDSPILTFENGRLFANGSPWSGKTPCFKNEKYPVAAIVRLQQASENSIKKLSAIESIAALHPSLPPAFAQEPLFEPFILNFISRIIKSVPVFQLKCLPNIQAAILTKEKIGLSNRKISIPNAIVFEEVSNNLLQGNKVIIPLQGNSMKPLLSSGDLLHIYPIDNIQNLRKGDIVLFKFKDQYILHRIKRIRDDIYIMQGDALNHTETICREDIIGILKAVGHRNHLLIDCDGTYWKKQSRKVAIRKKIRRSIPFRVIGKIKKSLLTNCKKQQKRKENVVVL